MKRNRKVSRLGRAAGCAVLAAALVCGCAQQPAAQPVTPAAGTGQMYNGSLLDDGALRLFYGDEGATVLCGSTVLYQGGATETVALLEDEVTGETAYYLVSRNQVGEANARTSLLYDRTGALVYDCGVNSVANMADGRLILRDYVGFDYELTQNYHYRIVDLDTGTVLSVAEGVNNWVSDGAGYFLAVTWANADGPETVDADSPESWNSYNQLCYNSTTTVYDSNLQEVARFEHCRGMQAYGWFSDNGKGWVMLEFGEAKGQEETVSTKLYCPATGEMIDDYMNFCGDGLICTGTEEQGYRVRRLDSPAVLGEYDRPCELYLPELALVWRPGYGGDDYGYYEVMPDGAGLGRRVRFDYRGSTVALLFEDNELRVYDLEQQAAPLLQTQIELPEETYNVSLNAAEGGYVGLACYDREYNTIANRFYGAAGLLCDTVGEQYNSFYYLTRSEDGPVFAMGYDGPGGASLVDVVDAKGSVLCSGLTYAYQGYNVPEGLFSARRGFYVGWMTADGEWAYCESMFRTLSADDRISYIW